MSKVTISALFEIKDGFIKHLFDAKKYPWEVLTCLKQFILTTLKNTPKGYTELKEGVLVGDGVKISPNCTIETPAIIGKGTEIRPGAYLRGNVIIGENCVIGNSSELKNSVLLDNVQVPHYNYVGDSILGNYSHMGAGAICSNLKSDKATVLVKDGKTQYNTNLRKLGAILGDKVEIGCGCVLNPGTIIGKNTRVYPLTSVRGVIEGQSIVKSLDNIVKQK